MGTSTWRVAGMTCEHCTRAVAQEIGLIDGVESVEVDLVSGLVRITSAEPPSAEEVGAAVAEAGYDVAGP